MHTHKAVHETYIRIYTHGPFYAGQLTQKKKTIPQGQTSSPPKSFFTPTAKARPDQAALATSAHRTLTQRHR